MWQQIRFWLYPWVGSQPLSICFPRLFLNFLLWKRGPFLFFFLPFLRLIWIFSSTKPHLPRRWGILSPLNPHPSISSFTLLLLLRNLVHFLSKIFFVSSFFSALNSPSHNFPFSVRRFYLLWLLLRSKHFCEKLPIEPLPQVVSNPSDRTFPFAQHMLSLPIGNWIQHPPIFQCPSVWKLWCNLLQMVNFNWAMPPNDVRCLFSQKAVAFNRKLRKLWILCLQALIWAVFKERHAIGVCLRIF